MHYFLLILMLFAPLLSNHNRDIDPKKRERVVLITTNFGEIQVKLYNETPVHRDNFIKLVKDGVYDSLLFHRVINQFMIQGGDPESKDAKPGKKLGDGTLGYTVPAEFIEGIYHKKGVLAAAREGDDINPEKASSASQFYLVQGKVFTDEELDALLQKMRERAFGKLLAEHLQQPGNEALRMAYTKASKKRDMVSLDSLNQAVSTHFSEELNEITFNETQRDIYTTVGGTPHLDGAYTVFGEIVEGLDVLDSIAAVQTDKNDRPLEDVVFSVSLLK